MTLPLEVLSGFSKQRRIVAEASEPSVAAYTEPSSSLAGFMVVVPGGRPSTAVEAESVSADFTPGRLIPELLGFLCPAALAGPHVLRTVLLTMTERFKIFVASLALPRHMW